MGCGIMDRAAGGAVFVPVWVTESDSGKNGDNTTIASQKTVCPGGSAALLQIICSEFTEYYFYCNICVAAEGRKKEKTVERGEKTGRKAAEKQRGERSGKPSYGHL